MGELVDGGLSSEDRSAADASGSGSPSFKRAELERMFDAKVYLEVWVKVKSGWADDERALKSLGYE